MIGVKEIWCHVGHVASRKVVVQGSGVVSEEFPLCHLPFLDEAFQLDCFGIYVPMKTFVAEHYHPPHLLRNFLCRLS